jgi:hypothetical protein
VRYHQRFGVGFPAHVEFDAGQSVVAGGAREGGKRVLVSTRGPASMRNEFQGRLANAYRRQTSVLDTA